mgnify:CR=1 FL=1
MGTDMFLTLHQWHEPERISRAASSSQPRMWASRLAYTMELDTQRRSSRDSRFKSALVP